MKKNYKKTLIACYLGFVTQAIAANFAPLLFLKFHNDYGISLGKIALIPTMFFLTQLTVDLLCAKFVDRIGYRKCVVASEVASAAGLIGLAFLPELLPEPFIGIILSVIVYAIGSGLIEVLVSPIVEACPFEHKDAAMSLLHSFYCWGSVGVVLLSTLFFTAFGIDSWKWLACIWALIPLYNIYNFATCPIERLVDEGKGMGIRGLFRVPMFWVAVILMVCAGASELSMAQWASAYAESAIGLSKTVGDLAGPCMFAVTMGVSRVIYGKYGDRMNLMSFMMGSGLLCLVCYGMASLSSDPVIGLVGCIVCGFSVGIMWPGTISISSSRLPFGGTAMFAMLAMAGDLGGAFGPSLVGNITEAANDNLQAGMLAGSVFPLVLLISLLLLKGLQRSS
ncbi:MAG TPA: MFS transporter [Candidatus Blautia faecigallinarum]|uniref:MFS transporter n=1 Tax=Candidatus Blautia faecigallinarum TaxID=2838488 RepID=A0A9D2IUR7_9FIRM|nr:MFS transporter [Candidatus Blautia faecigallinarum]